MRFDTYTNSVGWSGQQTVFTLGTGEGVHGTGVAADTDDRVHVLVHAQKAVNTLIYAMHCGF